MKASPAKLVQWQVPFVSLRHGFEGCSTADAGTVAQGEAAMYCTTSLHHHHGGRNVSDEQCCQRLDGILFYNQPVTSKHTGLYRVDGVAAVSLTYVDIYLIPCKARSDVYIVVPTYPAMP